MTRNFLFTQQSLFNKFTQFNVYQVFSVNRSNCSGVDRIKLNAINGSVSFPSLQTVLRMDAQMMQLDVYVCTPMYL